jgi:hypothetical protein
MKNIHVIPTDKPSMLGYLSKKGKEIFKDLRLFEKLMPNILDSENQHIYITSDEEIKEDWYLNVEEKNGIKNPFYGKLYKANQSIGKVSLDYLVNNLKKIILTTDQDLIKDGVQAIADEFLEWFVKNQACENVYVHKEYKQINQDNPITVGSTTLVFSHYEIVIPKEEPKDVLLGYKTSLVAQMLDSKEISEEPIEETLEDAAEKFVNNTRLQNRKVLFMEGAKWQQEQILNFLYEEITERRPYSASKMCEKVIEFIKKNDR